MAIHKEFINKRAEMMATKTRTSPHEKAIKEIIKPEESRRTFQNIRDLLGKQQILLTQVDVLTDPCDIIHHMLP
jgi:uncharacterized ferredoxin-like protein